MQFKAADDRQADFVALERLLDRRDMPTERAASILDRTTRGPIAEATRNSSYIEAILLDLRGVERR